MIYVDSNVIIRFVEGNESAREPIRQRISGDLPILTSQLSRMECRCKPMRNADVALLGLYDAFFAAAELRLIELDTQVIDIATSIRAAYLLTSPDAIHLAAAIVGSATVFLTGDKQLARCTRLPVEII